MEADDDVEEEPVSKIMEEFKNTHAQKIPSDDEIDISTPPLTPEVPAKVEKIMEPPPPPAKPHIPKRPPIEKFIARPKPVEK